MSAFQKSVIQYASKKSGVVPCVLVFQKDPDNVAEPTKDEEINLNSENWADLIVTAEESDEEEYKLKTEISEVRSEKECYECNLCIYRSEAVQVLVKHMIRKHTFMDGNYFVCGFCQIKFIKYEVLEKHVIRHFPKQRCADDSWKQRFGNRRVRWNKAQRAILEEAFKKEKIVHQETKLELAKRLKVDVERVQTWFRNRKCHQRLKKF